MQTTISERAVLMRFSAGVPGEEREDHRVSAEVKASKALGQDSGKWEKRLWPKIALAAVKSKITEARTYHNRMTIPFDTGTGILPAGRVIDYNCKMNEYADQVRHLAEETFLADPGQWIEWAKREHNGTFDPDNYPGMHEDGTFDADEFRAVMRRKFYVRGVMMPVPAAEHYTSTVALVLGQDTASIDQRVAEACADARRELLKRMLAPVQHMANKLKEEKPRIFETLIGNIADIAKAAKELNVTGDPMIDQLVDGMEALTRYTSDALRDSAATRSEAQKAAEAMMQRLAGYKI